MPKNNLDTIKDRIVSFDLAKILKDVGFPQSRLNPIKNSYNEHGELNGTILHDKEFIEAIRKDRSEKGEKVNVKEFFMKSYAAPTQSQVANWLRNNYGIQVCSWSMTRDRKQWKDYYWSVRSKDYAQGSDPRDELHQTYEDALEAGLFYAVELVHNKKY